MAAVFKNSFLRFQKWNNGLYTVEGGLWRLPLLFTNK